MIITVPDFLDWKSQPVTKAVQTAMDGMIQGVAGELADSAGTDQLHDRYRAGYIQGIRDCLNINVEDVEGEQLSD